MILDRLVENPHLTSNVDRHFGQNLAEQIIECRDLEALLELQRLVEITVDDLVSAQPRRFRRSGEHFSPAEMAEFEANLPTPILD